MGNWQIPFIFGYPILGNVSHKGTFLFSPALPLDAMKGQSTIELLIILSVLFIILALSIGIFSQQMSHVNAFRISYGEQRNGEALAEAVSRIILSPIGTQTRVFMSPSSETQTIRVLKRTIIVTTPSSTTFVSLPGDTNTDASFSTRGGIIQLQRTSGGIALST